MDPACWESLPNEIIEKIFLDIPTSQLPFNNAWVCQKWTKIILNTPFWLHKLKHCGIVIDNMIWSVLQKCETNKIVSCLYHACLYQEHRTQQTPFLKYDSYIPNDENYEDEDIDSEELEDKEAFQYDDVWVISDNFDAILMALGVLVCRTIRSDYFACLTLKDEKTKALSLLLKLLEARNVPLYVRDDYAFWNFKPRLNYLQHLKVSNDEAQKLLAFRGCLLTLDGIPSSFSVISLSIAVDENGFAIDPGLSRLNPEKSHLNGDDHGQINLYLKAGTNVSSLPDMYLNALFVSGLDQSHLLWLTEAAKKFLGTESILSLLDYQLDLTSSENLLKSLTEEGAKEFRCLYFTVKNGFQHLADPLECLTGKYDQFQIPDIAVFDSQDSLFEHLSCYFETFFEDHDMNLPEEIYMSKYGR